MNNQWLHWVGRATHSHQPFKEFDQGRFAWTKLKELFPNLLAGILMPNHFHLILPAQENSRNLTRFLISVSRQQKILNLWQPTPKPSIIPDRQHLRRHIRYIALNPCRKDLCRDPLEWMWSTYREFVGATIERPALLAEALGVSKHTFPVQFHSYVSADPAVNVEGTKFPKNVPPRAMPQESIGEILCAAAAALRTPTLDVAKKGQLRSLFIHMARRQGWRQTRILAEICRITPQAVRDILRHKLSPEYLDAAALCLGDKRLREGIPLNFAKAQK